MPFIHEIFKCLKKYFDKSTYNLIDFQEFFQFSLSEIQNFYLDQKI